MKKFSQKTRGNRTDTPYARPRNMRETTNDSQQTEPIHVQVQEEDQCRICPKCNLVRPTVNTLASDGSPDSGVYDDVDGKTSPTLCSCEPEGPIPPDGCGVQLQFHNSKNFDALMKVEPGTSSETAEGSTFTVTMNGRLQENSTKFTAHQPRSKQYSDYVITIERGDFDPECPPGHADDIFCLTLLEGELVVMECGSKVKPIVGKNVFIIESWHAWSAHGLCQYRLKVTPKQGRYEATSLPMAEYVACDTNGHPFVAEQTESGIWDAFSLRHPLMSINVCSVPVKQKLTIEEGAIWEKEASQ